MKNRWMFLAFLAAALAMTSNARQSEPDQQSAGNPPPARGWMGPGMGSGVMGTVTDVASDHYTVKTDKGETYTVYFSANTHIMKQPPAPSGAAQPGAMAANRPQLIAAADIKVGDTITARGEVDPNAKSVGAMFVVQIDPERAARMRAMEQSFGKTWLMGRVTAIDGNKITLQSGVDRTAHTFVADENTVVHQGRRTAAIADLHVGDPVRVDGAIKDGQFVATTVRVVMVRAMGGPAPRQGTTPPQ